MRFCRAYDEAGLSRTMRFRVFGRVNLMDEEMLEELARVGCFHIFYGLETGSERLIKNVKPGVSFEQALRIIDASLRVFDTVNVGLMWGFPDESYEDFLGTVALKRCLEAKEGCLVAFNWLYPYRGSKVCEEHLDELYWPEDSLMSHPDEAFSQAERLLSNSPKSLSSIRSMLAGAQTLQVAEALVRSHPRIFSDYFRLPTPERARKLAAVEEDAAF